MSTRFHLPESQQKHGLWHKPAELSEACLGLYCCLHQLLGCPTWQSCQLQHTTEQRHSLWRLTLAPVRWQRWCLHLAARKVGEVLLDPEGTHREQLALGNFAPKTVEQLFSGHQWCHAAAPIQRRTAHLAKPHVDSNCCQLPHCFAADTPWLQSSRSLSWRDSTGLLQQWFSSSNGSHLAMENPILGVKNPTLKSGKLLGLVCSFGFRYTDSKSSRIT